MKNILIIGAGRSSTTMIKYFLKYSKSSSWIITVIDSNIELALKTINNHENGKAFKVDIKNEAMRENLISEADIVISMLPPEMHYLIALDCIKFKKSLVTASYLSDKISSLNKKALENNILILNEMGLDPGIDHMSALHIINDLKKKKYKILSFKSFCGGLVHPNYDDNPWNYKITWNPRNVVLAGQGTSSFRKDGQIKEIPYSNVFETVENLDVLNIRDFEAYPNRDSLKYIESYALEEIETLVRGTLRKKGYCEAWNILVQLGITDDSYIVADSEKLSNKQFIEVFLPKNKNISIEERFCNFLKIDIDSNIFKKIKWLGLFDESKLCLPKISPAKFLQKVIEKKWKLQSNEKDMVVMQHQFIFKAGGTEKNLKSSLIVYGDDTNTAMSKTVGLPIAIVVKNILNEKIKIKGVKIPIHKEIYVPVLNELKDYGINFIEELV